MAFVHLELALARVPALLELPLAIFAVEVRVGKAHGGLSELVVAVARVLIEQGEVQDEPRGRYARDDPARVPGRVESLPRGGCAVCDSLWELGIRTGSVLMSSGRESGEDVWVGGEVVQISERDVRRAVEDDLAGVPRWCRHRGGETADRLSQGEQSKIFMTTIAAKR